MQDYAITKIYLWILDNIKILYSFMGFEFFRAIIIQNKQPALNKTLFATGDDILKYM